MTTTDLAAELTTERLLVHPGVFGITTATPTQRSIARALDGLPLAELADHPDVVDAFGGREAIRTLPTAEAPFEGHVLASIRSAKTMLAAARTIRMGNTVAADGLAAGDILRITVAALKLEGCRPLMRHIAAAMTKPLLRPLLAQDPTDDLVVIRHPSGRYVEIVPAPIDRAGGSAISVWNAGAIVDEEPRMLGADDGAVKNWDEHRSALLGRILLGGQFLGIGSPHAPFGPVFELFDEFYGRPSPDLVLVRAGGPQMNPIWWTPARCAALLRRDPEAYRSDVLAQFRSIASSAIPIDAVDAAMGTEPHKDAAGGAPIIAVDLSAMRRDTCAIVVMQWVWPPAPCPHLWADGRAADGSPIRNAYPLRDERGQMVPNPDFFQRKPVLNVCHVEGFEPGQGTVTASMVADRVVKLAWDFDAHFVAGDQFDEFSFSALLRERNPSLRFEAFRWSGGLAGTKAPAIDRLRALLMGRQLILPKHAKLREELIRLRRVVTQGSERFEAAPGSTHGDYASAIITGIMADMANCIPYSPIGASEYSVISYDPYTHEATYE